MQNETAPVQSTGTTIGLRTVLLLLALLAGTVLSEGILDAWQAAPPTQAQTGR
jgi:hypothetical protein